MRKLLFLSIIFSISIHFIYAQNEYSYGFRNGYKAGYCYGDVGCVAPVPPVSPIPLPGENINDYSAGYNRGVLAGNEARQSEQLQRNSSTNYGAVAPQINIDYKPPVPENTPEESNKQNWQETYNEYNDLLSNIYGLKDKVISSGERNRYSQDFIDAMDTNIVFLQKVYNNKSNFYDVSQWRTLKRIVDFIKANTIYNIDTYNKEHENK